MLIVCSREIVSLCFNVEKCMVWMLTDLALVTWFALLFEVSTTETIHADTIALQD